VPTFGLGWSGAELVIRIIDGDLPHQIPVLLDTELVIRESCGASTAL
jgi:DNA-binding LacI/PurR family transcriptional regulator